MTMDREPPPPEVVVGWIRRFAGTGTGPGTALEGGMRALDTALSTSATAAAATPESERPAAGGSPRDSAWALLAADALLTWAVEDAADAPDPGAALESLVRRVQEAAPAESVPRTPRS